MATYCKDVADTKIIDCDTFDNYENEIRDTLKKDSYYFIGIGMMFDTSYRRLKDIIGLINEVDPDTCIVLGGAAASYSYREILEDNPNIHAICFSEGEIPFRELLVEGNFKNKAWITHMKLKQGVVPEKQLLYNLDELINLDYSLVDSSAYNMQEAFSPYARYGKKCFF